MELTFHFDVSRDFVLSSPYIRIVSILSITIFVYIFLHEHLCSIMMPYFDTICYFLRFEIFLACVTTYLTSIVFDSVE